MKNRARHMKRRLRRPHVVAAVLVTLTAVAAITWAWAATDVVPVTVTAERVNASPVSPDDPIWDTIAPETINTSTNAILGGHGSFPSTRPDISVKAAYNGEDLYTYFEWADPTENNLHSYWQFNGVTWEKFDENNNDAGGDVDEDRLFVMWPINDGPGRENKTFAEKGCAMTCHVVSGSNWAPTPESMDDCSACHGNANPKTEDFNHMWTDDTRTCDECHSGGADRSPLQVGDHAITGDASFDIWHWKAGRASNIGMADDQVISPTKKRGNDLAGLDGDNKLTSLAAPKYIWPLNASLDASTGDKSLPVRESAIASMSQVSSDGLTLLSGDPVPVGTTVRAKTLFDVTAKPDTNDILSQHSYEDGVYRVVLKRKLDTGSVRDYAFDLDGENLFSVAVTENSGFKHAGNAGPHTLLFGSWQPTVSSSSHPNQNAWYSGKVVTASLSAEAATVDAFSYVVDQSPTMTPDTVADLTPDGGMSTLTLTDAADGTWYLHVSGRDEGGEWSDPMHFRFNVDSTLPSDPASLTSSHTTSSWNNDDSVHMNWNAGTDTGSGVDGYSYSFTAGATDVPDNAKDAEQTATSYTQTLADGSWYFHLRTLDNAGNWTSTKHYGPIRVDDTKPAAGKITGLGSSVPFAKKKAWNVAWGGAADTTSGVDDYDVRYRKATHTGVFGSLSTWRNDVSAGKAWFSGAAGSTYCFSTRSRDNAGNLAASWSAEKCIANPLNNTQLGHSAGWSKKSGSGRYLGTYSTTKRQGKILKAPSVKAKRISLVATKCPSCGKVKVYWGSTLLRTVDLKASSTKKLQVIPVKTFSSVRSGTVRVVTSTSGKPIIIEGLGLSKK